MDTIKWDQFQWCRSWSISRVCSSNIRGRDHRRKVRENERQKCHVIAPKSSKELRGKTRVQMNAVKRDQIQSFPSIRNRSRTSWRVPRDCSSNIQGREEKVQCRFRVKGHATQSVIREVKSDIIARLHIFTIIKSFNSFVESFRNCGKISDSSAQKWYNCRIHVFT